ncbi:hypothetical protein BpHYR1_017841 [Brachionus plicatilis]|uniref:Uncharacterized protein n=1 Tax=Brachionus plicatilis TaxID=10195 RepID=A0A3M7QVY2_BRAPC|nr:hypothetical protein BpHYR1_017841 [Brachionus plicatilis]
MLMNNMKLVFFRKEISHDVMDIVLCNFTIPYWVEWVNGFNPFGPHTINHRDRKIKKSKSIFKREQPLIPFRMFCLKQYFVNSTFILWSLMSNLIKLLPCIKIQISNFIQWVYDFKKKLLSIFLVRFRLAIRSGAHEI